MRSAGAGDEAEEDGCEGWAETDGEDGEEQVEA